MLEPRRQFLPLIGCPPLDDEPFAQPVQTPKGAVLDVV
jgi:hypothetical protein